MSDSFSLPMNQPSSPPLDERRRKALLAFRLLEEGRRSRKETEKHLYALMEGWDLLEEAERTVAVQEAIRSLRKREHNPHPALLLITMGGEPAADGAAPLLFGRLQEEGSHEVEYRLLVALGALPSVSPQSVPLLIRRMQAVWERPGLTIEEQGRIHTGCVESLARLLVHHPDFAEAVLQAYRAQKPERRESLFDFDLSEFALVPCLYRDPWFAEQVEKGILESRVAMPSAIRNLPLERLERVVEAWLAGETKHTSTRFLLHLLERDDLRFAPEQLAILCAHPDPRIRTLVVQNLPRMSGPLPEERHPPTTPRRSGR